MDTDTLPRAPESPPSSSDNHLPDNDLRSPVRVPAPLGTGLTATVGFLLGVFVMFVLRTEMAHLRDSAWKFAVLLGLALVLGVSLLPPFARMRRLLAETFPEPQARVLLHTLLFLLWAGVVLVTIVCGLLFLVVV